MIHKELGDLDPAFARKAMPAVAAMQLDAKLKSLGYGVIVLETKRDLAVQMAYAVKARMRGLVGDPHDDLGWVQAFFKAAEVGWIPSMADNGRPSTWTLESKHLLGKAIDIAPTKDGKTAFWNAPDEVWDRMAEIGESFGMAAGRRWKTKDSPHFEEP